MGSGKGPFLTRERVFPADWGRFASRWKMDGNTADHVSGFSKSAVYSESRSILRYLDLAAFLGHTEGVKSRA
jgi:hypothetical protein